MNLKRCVRLLERRCGCLTMQRTIIGLCVYFYHSIFFYCSETKHRCRQQDITTFFFRVGYAAIATCSQETHACHIYRLSTNRRFGPEFNNRLIKKSKRIITQLRDDSSPDLISTPWFKVPPCMGTPLLTHKEKCCTLCNSWGIIIDLNDQFPLLINQRHVAVAL